MRLKRPSRQRELRFDVHGRVWTSVPVVVRRRVIDVLRELLQTEFYHRREVRRSEHRQDHP